MKNRLSLWLRLALLPGAAVFLSACSSGPRPADWQVEAKGAMERSITAYMTGNRRVEAAEMTRARNHLSRTGRADLLATAELMRCASRVASLVFEPCVEFESLRHDAGPAQGAYADYLQGQISLSDIALLPPAQRVAAAGRADVLKEIPDPLSQLVAAGVLLKTGKASPAVMAQAVDTASGQGWPRPLLAWLGAQAQYADENGNPEEAARLRRRMALTASAGLPLQNPVKESP